MPNGLADRLTKSFAEPSAHAHQRFASTPANRTGDGVGHSAVLATEQGDQTIVYMNSLLKTALAGLLMVQLSGCGTLLYPERRGTEPGRLDADIVLLDAVGLLFFVIPGVVAFAVDFVTGAIYLPSGKKSRVSELLGSAEPDSGAQHRLTLTTIEAVASEATGSTFNLTAATTWVLRAPAGTDVPRMLEDITEAAVSRELPILPGHSWRRLDEFAQTSGTAAAG